jgi:hypothetical protein
MKKDLKRVSELTKEEINQAMGNTQEALNRLREAKEKIVKQECQPEMKALVGKCFVSTDNKNTVLAPSKKEEFRTIDKSFKVFYKIIEVTYNMPGNHHCKILTIERRPAFYGGFEYFFHVNNFYQSIFDRNEQISAEEFQDEFENYLDELKNWTNQ